MTTTVAPLQGTTAKVNNEALAELRMVIHGEVLTPEDPGYAAVPAAYNAMYPGRPDVVVRASGTADVIDAVKFARAQGLVFAIRAGGHSVAGLSSIDGGLLLDLSLMNGVHIDPDNKTVTCQGGARWGDVDRDTAVFGLVAPGGIVSDTGVAGLTLGGGEGWVRRKYGLACDNLLEAQVVTAEGEVVTANAKTNKDLFWALRGGGGNFGVVTSFTFKLSPLPPVVGAAITFYPAADAEKVLRGYRDFMKNAPDEVTALCACTTLPASEHTPPQIHNVPMISVGAVYVGDPEKGLKLMQPLRELAEPLADTSGPLPFAAGVQKAFDEFFQRGVLRSYWKSTYLDDFSDDALALVANAYKTRASTRTLCVVFSWGGAINKVGAEDTANTERSANWMFSCDGNWEDPAEDSKVISWVRERWAEVHALGTGSVYLNFTGVADEGADVGVDDAFSRNLKRLREIKKTYDPTNFFRINNNIKPAQ
jgi:FAD/FMN-containing dehydrogenase